MFLPYVYFITFTHPETRQKFYYIGSRTGKGCHPSDLFVTYFTSSKYMKELLKEYSLDNFKWEIRKTFDNRKDAFDYETKLLKRLKVTKREDFINRSDNNFPFYPGGPLTEKSRLAANSKRKKTNLERYGVESPSQSQEVKEKVRSTNLEIYGVEHTFQSQEVKEKLKATCIEKYGVDHPSQADKTKNTRIKNNIEKYGVNHTVQTDEFKDNRKKTMDEKYGIGFNVFALEETKEKIASTNIERYGVMNVMQNPDIAAKTSKKLKGIKRSDETRRKLSESKKGKPGNKKTQAQKDYMSNKYNGVNNPCFGKVCTTNEKENKFIYPITVLENGWRFGRLKKSL